MRGRAILTEIVLAGALILAVNAYLARHAASGQAPPLPPASLHKPGPQIANGEPLLVDFFATWCPVCRVDQGVAQALARHDQVVVVATQSPARAVRVFAEKHHWRTAVIMDEDGAIARRYGVRVLPMTFILGPRGRIRFVVAGYTTKIGLMARLWLARLGL
ncbi:MAG TPA: redoxin domain-containing protein [Acidiferrobacter sp.]|nr:redoxin domain-containing protein [Acidiferrobacter sp.]